MISFGCFVREEKCIGSWNDGKNQWDDLSIAFASATWGMKANEAVTPDGRRIFVYPLTVTEVVSGGEAERKGVKTGDVVVEMNSTPVRPRGDLRVIVSDQRQPVSDTIQEILVRGGVCEMRIKRRRVTAQCTECGGIEIEEVFHRGDMVCRSCGVVQRSNISFIGSSYENETTTHVELGDETMSEKEQTQENDTNTHIEAICTKLELNSSIITHAKKEAVLFQKINSERVRKMRYRPLEALAASCVVVVCRLQNIGRTEKEILAVCSCTKKHLALVLKAVNRGIVECSKRHVPTSNTQDVIQRFCTNMQMPALVAKTATHIVKVLLLAL
jgi:hypothetical protein